MRKIIYPSLLLTFLLLNNSCTMMIKGLSDKIANSYDQHTDINLATLRILDKDGKEDTFGNIFHGKTVYLNSWNERNFLPPSDRDSNYYSLKRRFEKQEDVVFINLYTGNQDVDLKKVLVLKNKDVNAYRLSSGKENAAFRDLLGSTSTVQIIGKTGSILSFQGPVPEDNITVDYILDKARSGQNGTQSAKNLIKGINGSQHFKTKELKEWYRDHFGEEPKGKLHPGLSSSKLVVRL